MSRGGGLLAGNTSASHRKSSNYTFCIFKGPSTRWDGSPPVQEQQNNTDLGVVGVLKDSEVHATHEPVEGGCEAGSNGPELLRTHIGCELP